jgi:hypothetical protein
MRQKMWSYATILAVSGSVGVWIGLFAPVGASAGGARILTERANLADPNQSLKDAQAAAPYELLLPSVLPSGAELVNADWTNQEGESTPVVGVDVWYQLSDGSYLHVWETNDPALEGSGKDPVSPPIVASTSEQDNGTWVLWKSEDPEYPVMSVAARFDVGVTVAVDVATKALSESELIDVAASIGK